MSIINTLIPQPGRSLIWILDNPELNFLIFQVNIFRLKQPGLKYL